MHLFKKFWFNTQDLMASCEFKRSNQILKTLLNITVYPNKECLHGVAIGQAALACIQRQQTFYNVAQ